MSHPPPASIEGEQPKSSIPQQQSQQPGQPPSSSSSSASSSVINPLSVKPVNPFTCLVLGASGATGRVLVGKLANNPRVERINAIVRKELPVDYFGVQLPANAEKIHQSVVDFEHLNEHAEVFKGYNTAFCCLGSTRSKAGSKEAFYHFDFDYITEAAKLCKAGGTYHFNLVSTTGADHKSFFHYLRTKGQIEQFIQNEVKFPSFSIFRPGLLLTDRPGETRLGESIFQKILPFFHPILPEKHCGVYVETVAEAMMNNTEFMLANLEKENGGVPGAEAIAASVGASKSRIFENDEIRAMKVAKL